MWEIIEVEYKISTKPSAKNFIGYQSKSSSKGRAELKLFISNLWDCTGNFIGFLNECITTILVERICLEFAFNKIRLKPTRCKSFMKKGRFYPCVPGYIAYQIYEDDFFII